MSHAMVSRALMGATCSVLALASPSARAAGNNEQALGASRLLGRGMNLGNALDAPREGEWGVTLEEAYFSAIREAGFDSVSIPIRWSAHAEKKAPYKIDPGFLGRVDWAVAQGLKHQLTVLLKIHQYQGFASKPEAELPRYTAIWQQLAEHFKGQPPQVMFEISNEPGYVWNFKRWNAITADVLQIIRRTNPKRTVIVCPIFRFAMGLLSELELPESERNILVRLHYFSPEEFTHQGASWVSGADRWLGVQWRGTEQEKQPIARDFGLAAAWAKAHNRVLFLGEFGAFHLADLDSRARWTRFVVEQARKHNLAWTYWEFCAGFGAYDPEKREWRRPLLDALLSNK
jgi:endoglucanase